MLAKANSVTELRPPLGVWLLPMWEAFSHMVIPTWTPTTSGSNPVPLSSSGLPQEACTACATKRQNTKRQITKRRKYKTSNCKTSNCKTLNCKTLNCKMLNPTECRILQNVEIQNVESYRTSKYKTSNIQKVEQLWGKDGRRLGLAFDRSPPHNFGPLPTHP